MPESPVLLTMPEAAERLRLKRTTAHELARNGRFPVPIVKIGGRYRVSSEAIDRFLESLSGRA